MAPVIQTALTRPALALLLTAMMIAGGCGTSARVAHEPARLVDREATRETRNLFENLRRVAADRVLFGHQNTLGYGYAWTGEPGRSDVYETAGAFPAVYGWDANMLFPRRPEDEATEVRTVNLRDWIIEGFSRGGVITLSWHFYNPVTGRNFYDTTRAVHAIVPGGSHHRMYREKLDTLAEFFQSLRYGDHVVPVIFRPYHEHNGHWFWWGARHSTREDFIDLWRFTVRYLRDEKGVRNLLWAYSPDVFESKEDYLDRYPGDEYVDIFGFDDYHSVRSPETRDVFVRRLRDVVELAESRGKIPALTETGLEAIPDSTWWTETLLNGILADPVGRRIAWLLVWRNAHNTRDRPEHYYAPYPGHLSAGDFTRFREHPAVLFEGDTGNLYGLEVDPITHHAERDDRIRFNGRNTWLSGGNVAWINFARDIGPGETRLDLFEEIFREMRDSGGNIHRLWLHTNGSHTPEWSGDSIVGPGEGAIEDLRAILDLAHRYGVSVMPCLWSFDMLRIRFGEEVTDRNFALLTEEEVLDGYIRNALEPMVEALKGHPAIFAWEIFNEPEGMSHEFGWPFIRHVPMADIQRFINRTTGAIKRIDPDVMVTNGSWSFRATSDVTAGLDLLVDGKTGDELSEDELASIQKTLTERYDYEFSLEQAQALYDTLLTWGPNQNYYTDDRLIAAGGDPDGVLDFYTVHYYQWGWTLQSPFHHDKAYWQLDKPLVVAEFYMDDAFGVPWQKFYDTLRDRGYAGALGWQWFDAWRSREGIAHNWPRVLENIRRMHSRYFPDVRLSLAPPGVTAARPAAAFD